MAPGCDRIVGVAQGSNDAPRPPAPPGRSPTARFCGQPGCCRPFAAGAARSSRSAVSRAGRGRASSPTSCGATLAPSALRPDGRPTPPTTLLAGVSERAAARSANESTVSAGRQVTARAPHRRQQRGGVEVFGRNPLGEGNLDRPVRTRPRVHLVDSGETLGGKVVSDTHQGWPEAAVDQRDLAAERSKLRIGRRGAPVCRRATDANARIAPSMTERALTSSASDRPLRRTGPREPWRSHFPAGLSMPCASCEDRSTRRRRLVAARGRSYTRRSETPGVAVCDLAGNSAVIPRAGHRANCHGGPMRSAVSLRR